MALSIRKSRVRIVACACQHHRRILLRRLLLGFRLILRRRSLLHEREHRCTGGIGCSDAAFNGERNGYELVRWAKSINVCSLRQRLYYHGKEIVLGGDAYAHVWETVNLTPCDILKVPHHASFDSTSRKLLEKLQPKTAVVTVAARRPDERPHPYVVSLLQEYVENLYFTDAVELPGLVEPQFHKSVHLEVE